MTNKRAARKEIVRSWWYESQSKRKRPFELKWKRSLSTRKSRKFDATLYYKDKCVFFILVMMRLIPVGCGNKFCCENLVGLIPNSSDLVELWSKLFLIEETSLGTKVGLWLCHNKRNFKLRTDQLTCQNFAGKNFQNEQKQSIDFVVSWVQLLPSILFSKIILFWSFSGWTAHPRR